MRSNTFVERELYTKELKKFVDVPLIKIITGIRRSGKSVLLELFQKDLLASVDKEQIIHVNLEDVEFSFITDYKELHDYVLSRIKDDRRYYIFLDEIQNVEGWEKGVNSLRLRNTDIYITGSNSKLLSGELSTLLTGRYVEFRLYTLSFREFIGFRKEYGIGSDDIDNELYDYIRIGGFPILSKGRFDDPTIKKIITDMNSSVILRDVVQRNNIRNVQLLQKVIDFVYDNVGKITTAKKISDYFQKEKRKVDIETIYNYLRYLEDALMIHKVRRYDVKGKRLLETLEKYYLEDHSLQYAVRGYDAKNLPGILENIVYLELLRRGFSVSTGIFDDNEIELVAENSDGKVYIQVCYLFSGDETIEREFRPLLKIRDSHPKLVVTMDRYWNINMEGARGMHLKDFLLSDDFL
jgi:predicted AAA+ superfamily ATPase